jgi:hypothetical protein
VLTFAGKKSLAGKVRILVIAAVLLGIAVISVLTPPGSGPVCQDICDEIFGTCPLLMLVLIVEIVFGYCRRRVSNRALVRREPFEGRAVPSRPVVSPRSPSAAPRAPVYFSSRHGEWSRMSWVRQRHLPQDDA